MGISLKGILGTVAPIIASALPGPLGGIAKKVVTDLLGLKEGSTQDEIEKALAVANPDVLLKLKQLDADFATKMKQLDIDLEKLEYEDVASARAMQIQTKAWLPPTLAIIVTVGFFTAWGMLIFRTFPGTNTEALMILLGALSTGWGQILQFYFGSSHSSQKKDETISNLSR